MVVVVVVVGAVVGPIRGYLLMVVGIVVMTWLV